MDRYRFTVTTYDRRQLEKCKNILTARLSHNYTELTFTFNQHTHKGRSLSFWVDVTFPLTIDHQSALFRILNVFRTAMASEKMTLSLDTKLPNEQFRCADVDICVREVTFGLVHSPFQFQSVCIVDPMQQRFINLDKFIDNYQQVYRISFFHDRRLCELQMPMFDAMDRQRFQMRMKRKHGGAINIAEAKRIQAYLKAENDPDGCRNELNEVLVRLPYENIKLLIFDVDDVTAKTIKGDLIIIYEHPPMAYIYPLTKSGERAVNYAPRYVRWSKNFSIMDFMEPMVQSSAMKLRVAFEKDVFYSLIAMNKLRLSCDVSFRKVSIAKNFIDLTIKDTKYQQQWPFEIRYLIDCILSRGSIGKRAILGSQGNYERVFGQVRKYLSEVDGTNRATNYLLDIFFKVLKASQKDLDSEEEEVVRRRFQSNIDDPSYIAIRKAIITPTRILYYPPEPAMGCRLIRRFKPDRFLRVVFRDDTMDTLHNLSEALIDETITKLMKDGMTVGGQKFFYLGYSNSQLRDQGCYFYRGDDVSALMEVYNCMGEFKKENVAKTMARFAQCFTQSYASEIELPRSRVAEIPDYANNSRDAKGNSYCFSDGVGIMSLTTAKLLQLELGFKTTPSCYQFRYAGYKGVVSVDPYLSNYAEFIEANALTPHETTPFTKDILFRPSQNKFTANDEHSSFEMVKRSAPCAVNLNKQLINIYDQVASKQSQRVHENVTKRILQLTDARITSIMKSLTDEGSFQLVLRELPAFVPYRQLRGFNNLVVEPFFRRLVLAWAKSSLKYLSEKARIPVPPDFGRNMFGIVDETGYLQYGQVFVQYSESIYEHSGNTNAIILKGNVMITKNPMMNGGDLRKFNAIDVPALRHLRDVVVFPQHGPRPAPDEMAGSDLDGDEYSVIWDPELMLEFSAPAMDYSPEPAKAEKVTFEDLLEHANILGRYHAASDKECHMMTVRAKSIEFFKNYLLNDSIGVVANAHLGNSDLYGIDSRVCERIARKQIAAVDFAKSGVPMEPLQKFWINKEPPERVERYPDFMSKDHRPFYQSNRLMGHVHRKIQQFVDSVGAFIDSDADLAVLDEYVDLEGWEKYENEAEVIYENYTEELQRLLMNFGIKNEAELFSQCFTDIKFRQLRNQESDNLSGFSTASLIQKHLYGILGRYRKEFFAEMRGGIDNNPQDPRTYLLTRFSHVLTSKLRQKAVAYYKVAYRAGTFLSFPWMVWDVIDTVRMDKRPLIKYDPRGEHLSAEIERITSDNYHLFILRIVKNAPAVLPYLDRYDGLGTMLHCLWQWKERRESLSVISDAEIIYIFMLYACGEMFTSPAVIRRLHELSDSPTINLRTRPGGLGRMLLGFFITISRDDFFDYPQNWLVTNSFGFAVTEDFCDVAKWRLLHAAARDTYFKSVFQSSPTLLASETSDNQSTVMLGEIFTIEVMQSFEHCINDALMRHLCHLTGCSHIAWRVPDVMTAHNRQRDDYRIRVILWPKGSLNAVQRLRSLLTINAPISRNEKPADLAFLMKHHTTVKMNKLLQARVYV